MHTNLNPRTDASGCVTFAAPLAESNRSRRKRVRKLVFMRGLTFAQAERAADVLTESEIENFACQLPAWVWER